MKVVYKKNKVGFRSLFKFTEIPSSEIRMIEINERFEACIVMKSGERYPVNNRSLDLSEWLVQYAFDNRIDVEDRSFYDSDSTIFSLEEVISKLDELMPVVIEAGQKAVDQKFGTGYTLCMDIKDAVDEYGYSLWIEKNGVKVATKSGDLVDLFSLYKYDAVRNDKIYVDMSDLDDMELVISDVEFAVDCIKIM